MSDSLLPDCMAFCREAKPTVQCSGTSYQRRPDVNPDDTDLYA